jgi:hypothetical protein
VTRQQDCLVCLKLEALCVGDYYLFMSVTEIIQEIPRLSLAERRMLAAKIVELEPDREVLEMCDRLTDESLQILDKMEGDDAHRLQG